MLIKWQYASNIYNCSYNSKCKIHNKGIYLIFYALPSSCRLVIGTYLNTTMKNVWTDKMLELSSCRKSFFLFSTHAVSTLQSLWTSSWQKLLNDFVFTSFLHDKRVLKDKKKSLQSCDLGLNHGQNILISKSLIHCFLFEKIDSLQLKWVTLQYKATNVFFVIYSVS